VLAGVSTVDEDGGGGSVVVVGGVVVVVGGVVVVTGGRVTGGRVTGGLVTGGFVTGGLVTGGLLGGLLGGVLGGIDGPSTVKTAVAESPSQFPMVIDPLTVWAPGVAPSGTFAATDPEPLDPGGTCVKGVPSQLNTIFRQASSGRANPDQLIV
jgi:hypothetical protein